MTDLFTHLAEVEARTQAGIERSAATAGDEWHEAALDAVHTYASTHPTVFVDDLWEQLPAQPEGSESGRALGKVIQAAARAGWIVKQPAANGAPGDIVCRPSVRSNGAPKAVWSSNVYREQAA